MQADENAAAYSPGPGMDDDIAGKILPLFHFSPVAKQLPACAHLFGICHGSPDSAWHFQGKYAGHLEDPQVQSMGHARV
jgi:hypothetical protein